MELQFPKPKGFGRERRAPSPKRENGQDSYASKFPRPASPAETSDFFADDVLRQYKEKLIRHGFDSPLVLLSLSPEQMDLMLQTCGVEKLGHQLYIRNKFGRADTASLQPHGDTPPHDRTFAKSRVEQPQERVRTTKKDERVAEKSGKAQGKEPGKSSFQMPPDDSSVASSQPSEPYSSPAALADHIIANLLLSSDPVELQEPPKVVEAKQRLQGQRASETPASELSRRDVDDMHQSNPYQTLMQLLQDRSGRPIDKADGVPNKRPVLANFREPSTSEPREGTPTPLHARRRAARGLSPRSIALSPHFPQQARQL